VENPSLAIEKMFSMIELKDHCVNVTEKISKKWMRNTLFNMIRSRDSELRILIVPLIYRLFRCSPQDISVWHHFISKVKSKRVQPYRDYTQLVYANIGLSEMMGNGGILPSIQEMLALQDKLQFSADLSSFSRYLYDIWPRYATDQYFNRFVVTNTPFLMVQGDLDPQTIHTLADFLYENIRRNSKQHLVKFRNLQHRVIARGDCPFMKIMRFMENENEIPSRECAITFAIDFEGSSSSSKRLSLEYFGRLGLWD
jgi:hypothetical protein